MTWAGEQKTLSCKKVESDWRQGSDKMKKHNLNVETLLGFLKNKGKFKQSLHGDSFPFNVFLLLRGSIIIIVNAPVHSRFHYVGYVT